MLKTAILTGVLGAAFLFAGAASPQARPSANCGNRIRSEEAKLQRDIQKHGWNSRQAQHRRDKIHRLRRECGGGFWNFWGRDRDRRWDRDDRRWNRDRDRDDWFWDGRQWRRRDRDRNDWYWDGRQWRRR